MTCIRNFVFVSFMYYLNIIFHYDYNMQNVNTFLMRNILMLASIVPGYSVGILLQDVENLRSRRNAILIIIFTTLNFAFSVNLIFNFIDTYILLLEINYTLCLFTISASYPFVIGFMESQISENLKVFATGITVFFEQVFGYFPGAFLIGLFLQNRNDKRVLFAISSVSLLNFLLSLIFIKYIRKGNNNSNEENFINNEESIK